MNLIVCFAFVNSRFSELFRQYHGQNLGQQSVGNLAYPATFMQPGSYFQYLYQRRLAGRDFEKEFCTMPYQKPILKDLDYKGYTVDGLLEAMLKKHEKKYSGIIHNIINKHSVDKNVLEVLDRFHDFSDRYNENMSEDCSICSYDLTDIEKPVSVLRCEHFFHSDCLKEWFKKSSTCPVCREEQEKDPQVQV